MQSRHNRIQVCIFLGSFPKLTRVCFCRKYVEAIGNSTGSFEDAETDNEGKMGGETLRVKVRLDVNEPIRRGTNVKIGAAGETKWIPITYENYQSFVTIVVNSDMCFKNVEKMGLKVNSS